MSRVKLPFLLLLTCSLAGIVFSADDWWEYGHFYQIYPRSFQDSDGDGVGDLNGITSRLPYLKTLNVSGVWLSPIFQSPMRDMGYDISDFRKIHREFGTMADFDRLLERCKELDIKLILDFVPNHTSDQHEWFKKSADPQDPEHYKYKDYYIWHKGKLLSNGMRVPPSNWVSIFGGSMWTWVSSRKAFYLHQFMAEQPDLNFRNKIVQREMKKVLRFWLSKGVSGFRIDAVPHLFEAAENLEETYDDEPRSGQCVDEDGYCYHTHSKTTHLNETYEMIYKWRKVMDEFGDYTRILMTEAYGSIPQMVKYYGRVKNGVVVKYGVQVPFNFGIINLQNDANARDFITGINSWINAMPKGIQIQPNWVMGNHDFKRIGTRFGPDLINIINILVKTLPGITVTYYGEEIGMTDVDEVASKDYRFPARTPMQWNDSTNAGFSTAKKTWLPVAENYEQNNVKAQESEENSHLKVFQQLISMREHPTLKYGTVKFASTRYEKLLIYKREMENQPKADIVVIALNLSDQTIDSFDLNQVLNGLPNIMNVTIGTHSRSVNQTITSFGLSPFEGVVLLGANVVQDEI